MPLKTDLSVGGPGPRESPLHVKMKRRTTLSRPGTAPGEAHIACFLLDIFQTSEKHVSDCRQESGIT